MKNKGHDDYELHLKCADVDQADLKGLLEKYKLSKREETDSLVIW